VILTGWKEIASHLRCGIRTAQRWEHEGLPVKRVTRTRRSPVVADSDELDAWTLRNPAFLGTVGTPERRATIQRARDLRAEAQRVREKLRLTMADLRNEVASIRDKELQIEKGLYERRRSKAKLGPGFTK
jgi:hypothetical protein